MVIDEEYHFLSVSPDYIMSKQNKKIVIEIKSPDNA